MRQQDHVRLDGLRSATASVLREAIGDTACVAILDAPNQRNVGDSLIWAGELAYLAQLGLTVRYVADIAGYRAEDLRAAMPRGVVLLHGGGNFGDLWPGHQRHREQIVADLPDYRIVQLPQSVCFRSADAAARANAVMSGHPDITVLLRDTESIARAAVQLPDLDTRFCHDLAFGWTPPRPRPPGRRVLVIGRRDVEGASGLATIPPDWLGDVDLVRTDWGAVSGWPGRRWSAARLVVKADHRLARERTRGRMPRLRPVHRAAERALHTINRINIDNALDLYGGTGLVIVDRLHAHVLAGLLGIPHIVLDNSYRKIGSVYDGYSGAMSTAHYATSLAEARALAEGLLRH